MKSGILIPLLLCLILFSSFTFAQEKDCLYYFYGQGCPDCPTVDAYLNELQTLHPDLNIQRFEVYFNKPNWQLMQNYFNLYEVPKEKQGLPAIFLPKTYLVGESSIREFLESFLSNNPGERCPSLRKDNLLGVLGETAPRHIIQTLTFPAVAKAALISSFNLCALAVFLILLSILLSIKRKKRLLIAGFAFTAAIYLAYLLFGLGLLSTFATPRSSFYNLIGIIAILVGLLNIRRSFLPPKPKIPSGKTPWEWKPSLKKLFRALTSSPVIFILAFILGLFELPCTSGSYLIILGLLAEKATQWATLPLLLFYNLVFVLPLLLLTLVVYFITTGIEEYKENKIDVLGKIASWRQTARRLVFLLGGLILLALGIVLLFVF